MSNTGGESLHVNTVLWLFDLPRQWNQWHQTRSAGSPSSSVPQFWYIPVSPVDRPFMFNIHIGLDSKCMQHRMLEMYVPLIVEAHQECIKEMWVRAVWGYRQDLLWLCSVLRDPTLAVHKPQALLQTLHSMSETQIPHVHSTPACSGSYLSQQGRV